MLKYHAEDIRPIALVGHRACGKTSLADALLHKAHAVERLGSVDDGTSYSDFDDEEHSRHSSVDTSLLHLEHAGKLIHLLDAPGSADFVGAALEALNAVETAVIVISASAGVEVNTRRMFHTAGQQGLARMIVINKLDADNVHFPELIESIRASFGKQCVLFNIPDRVGASFSRVIDVLNPPASEPADLPVNLRDARSMMIEAIVECDEHLLEQYLSDGELESAELEQAIPHALEAGTVIPIFCTAARNETGIDELMDAIAKESLSPLHAQVRLNSILNGQAEHFGSENGAFVGQVVKSVNDKFVGNLSFIRIVSGKMDTTHPLINLRTGKSSRVAHLLMMQGKTHETVAEAHPGDIVGVAKIEGLHIGDTVAFDTHAPRLPDPVFPRPMFGLAIEPKNRGDEQKISQSLSRIADEDPTFTITHDAQTHELVINGISQVHLEVIQHRLKRRYDLEVLTHEPKIPYRETIQSEGAADYRHRKQSGGRGQFGEVHLRIYPLSREITNQQELEEQFANKSRFEKMRSVSYHPEFNFAFVDHIVGGTIPNQFMPAVEKGCRELLERGALAGYRIQDLAVEVFFGKDHAVDSSEAAFKTAGRMAFKKAILTAQPTLLEPIVKLEITIPAKYTGAILSDLNGKRGHVENQESLPGDLTVISARVPLAEIARYAAQLGSMTQGQGSYTMDFSHYDTVPPNVQQQIVAKGKVHSDEDE